MHGAHQHFLAGAAFALDQHGGLRARGLGRHRQSCAKRRSCTDHRIEIERRTDFFGQRLQFGGVIALGRAAQRFEQSLGRDGLDEIICRAGAHRFNRKQRRGTGRQHQDRQSGPARFQLGDQRAGFVARHPLVQNDRAELHALTGAQHRNGGFGIAGNDRAPTLARSERRDQAALRGLIVDQHQQAVFRLGHALPGSWHRAAEPIIWPGKLNRGWR